MIKPPLHCGGFSFVHFGAGYGNRTRVLALGRPHTTIVLIPQVPLIVERIQ